MFSKLLPEILREIFKNLNLADLIKLRAILLASSKKNQEKPQALHMIENYCGLHRHLSQNDFDAAFIHDQALRYFQNPARFIPNHVFYENSQLIGFLRSSSKDTLLEMHERLATQESKKNFLEELIIHEHPLLSEIMIELFLNNRLPNIESLLINNTIYNIINQIITSEINNNSFQFLTNCLNLNHFNEVNKINFVRECCLLASVNLFNKIIDFVLLSENFSEEFKTSCVFELLNELVDDSKCLYLFERIQNLPLLSTVCRTILENPARCSFTFLVNLPDSQRHHLHSDLYTRAHEICIAKEYYVEDGEIFSTEDIETNPDDFHDFSESIDPIESDLDALAIFYKNLTRLQFLTYNSLYRYIDDDIFSEFYNQAILEEELNPLQDSGLRPHPYEYSIAKTLHYWYLTNPELLSEKISELVRLFIKLNVNEKKYNRYFAISLLKILISFKIRHPDFPMGYEKELCHKAYILMNCEFEMKAGIYAGIALLMKKYFSEHFVAYQLRTSIWLSTLLNSLSYSFIEEESTHQPLISIMRSDSDPIRSFDDLLGSLIYLMRANYPNPMFILTQMIGVLMKLENQPQRWAGPLVEEIFHTPFPSDHGLNLLPAVLMHPYFNNLSIEQIIHAMMNVTLNNFTIDEYSRLDLNFYEKVMHNMHMNVAQTLVNFIIHNQIPISLETKKALLFSLLGCEIEFLPDDAIVNFQFHTSPPINLLAFNYHPLNFLAYLLRYNVDLGLHYATTLVPKFLNLSEVLNDYYHSEFSSDEDKAKINHFVIQNNLIGIDLQWDEPSSERMRM